MTPPDPAQIAAARTYEAIFVPALFREWGPRLVAAAGIRPGDRVLDVACGTGALTRAVAGAVGSAGRVTGLDPNRGMLAVARELAAAIEWRHGAAEALPFPDGTFDRVVSQFGLMFFSDRAGALREMRRVLRPGGGLAVAVWASLDDTPAYAAEVALLERLAGPEAGNALKAPFVLGDPDELLALFAEAGLPDATVETIVGRGRFPSIRALVETDVRGWLPLMGVRLSEELIERILHEAETVLGPFRTPTGGVEFASPAHLVSV